VRTHGKYSTYTRGGCRCDECRAAAAAYQRRRVEQRRNDEKPQHVHGTENGYVNYACRCDECREAWAAIVREQRARRAKQEIPSHVHGTPNGYSNYRCRCDACMAADREQKREIYNRLHSAEARGVPPRGTVCGKGHDLTEGSPHLYRRRAGRKMCRTCAADRQRRRARETAGAA
jgi:hypothetical protein